MFLTIEDGVKTIDAEAFANCEKLEAITIPWSVTTIGKGAFAGCPCEKSVKKQFPRYESGK